MTETTKNLRTTRSIPLYFRHCRFSVELPKDRLYTSDHHWLQQESPGIWRVGLAPWGVRLLGSYAAHRFDVAPGAATELHQPLGTLEGLQTVATIRALAAGAFLEGNPILAAHPDALMQDCCGTGWLYCIQGTPDPEALDATAYRRLLDQSVDAVYGDGPQLQ